MKDFINKIAEYQKLMGYDFETMTIEDRMQMMRNYVAALMVEQGELLKELPWKPWRKQETQYYATQQIQAEEWVDCLFFLVDQALVLRLSSELIEQAFEAKLRKNINRISSGYSTKGGK